MRESIAAARWGAAASALCMVPVHHRVRTLYTATEGEERKTKVRVQQVVAADLQLEPISETNMLPKGMSKKSKGITTKKNAQKIDKYDHEAILDEICRREAVEQEEELEDPDSEDEDDDADSGEEEEGEEDN